MTNRITHVKNPLTVIAIFAGLAEVSGTAVLPLLKENTQEIYVWFLMVFPCLLVMMFFTVLFFRHHVLYAPSDYRDESIFASLFVRGSTTQRLEKLAEEVRVIEEQDPDAAQPEARPNETDEPTRDGSDADASTTTESKEAISSQETTRPSSKSEFLAKAALAEDLVVSKISKELGLPFTRDVRRSGVGGVMVDAFSLNPARPVAIETKYLTNARAFRQAYESGISTIMRFYTQLPIEIQSRFEGIIAFVIDDLDDREIDRIRIKAIGLANDHGKSVRINIYKLGELEKELSIEAGTRAFRFGE